jgi:hypothetical protein
MITKEQLINEIETVENQSTLELVYQLIQNLKKSSMTVKNHSKAEQQKAMAEFCGMFDDLPISDVEDILRSIRKGRRSSWDDI